MLQELMFCIDKVLPYFLIILLGFVTSRRGYLSKEFFERSNHFVYTYALPLLIFRNCAFIQWEGSDYSNLFIFQFVSIVLSVIIIWAFFEVICRKQRHLIGTLVQGAYRGNYSVLALPIIASVMGEESLGMASLLNAVIVPIYNFSAVIVLQARGTQSGKMNFRNLSGQIMRNRLICSTMLGVLVSLLPFRIPGPVDSALNMLGNTTAPLILMVVGSMLKWDSSPGILWPTVLSCSIKALILPAAMTFAAYSLGFRGTELYIVFASAAVPSAIASYSMAHALGGDASLAANILCVTTLLSAFVIPIGTSAMRILGWI